MTRSHIVKVRIVSHITFGKTVAGIHFHKRSLVALCELVPVVASVALLVAHMVRGHENILALEFVFPVLDGSAVDQRSIYSLVQCHVVTGNHTVGLIAYEGEKFPFLVVLLGHLKVFVVATPAKTPESICVITDYPFQARFLVEEVDVRPHCVRCDADEVQLAFCRFEGIAHITVSIGDVTVVVEVSPIEFESGGGRDHLFYFFIVCAGFKQVAGRCKSKQ